MNNQRIEKLKELIEEDPSDPFLLYGLAMEFAKGLPEKAILTFERLLNDFPDYLPTYYQAALILLEIGHPSKAKTILQNGIKLAEKARELKTRNELQSQLDSLDD
jgi:tetratricopeptide (TPR) repeat protein